MKNKEKKTGTEAQRHRVFVLLCAFVPFVILILDFYILNFLLLCRWVRPENFEI